MHPRTAVLPSFPQKNDALRQHPQHRIAALLLAKHADYNSLEKKKETLQTSRRFSRIQWKTEQKKKPQKTNREGGRERGDGRMVNHPDFPVISVSLQSQNKKQKPCQVEMPLQWVAVAHVDDSRNFRTGLVN